MGNVIQAYRDWRLQRYIRLTRLHAAKIRQVRPRAPDDQNTVPFTALLEIRMHGRSTGAMRNSDSLGLDLVSIPGLLVWTQMGNGKYGDISYSLPKDQAMMANAVSSMKFRSLIDFRTALQILARGDYVAINNNWAKDNWAGDEKPDALGVADRGQYALSERQTVFLNKYIATGAEDDPGSGVYVVNNVVNAENDILIRGGTDLLRDPDFIQKVLQNFWSVRNAHHDTPTPAQLHSVTLEAVYWYLRNVRGVTNIFAYDESCSMIVNDLSDAENYRLALVARNQLEFRPRYFGARALSPTPLKTEAEKAKAEEAKAEEAKGEAEAVARLTFRTNGRLPRSNGSPIFNRKEYDGSRVEGGTRKRLRGLRGCRRGLRGCRRHIKKKTRRVNAVLRRMR